MKTSVPPKIVFTDIDGIWTDGGMYYTALGDEIKKFNTRDSGGVLLLNSLGIPVVIVTRENTPIVMNRAKKLGIDCVGLGIHDKLQFATKECKTRSISLEDAAYIGDDIFDIPLLQKVGIAATTKDAPKYVQRECDFILPVKGGEGAFRCFVETCLLDRKTIEKIIRSLIS